MERSPGLSKVSRMITDQNARGHFEKLRDFTEWNFPIDTMTAKMVILVFAVIVSMQCRLEKERVSSVSELSTGLENSQNIDATSVSRHIDLGNFTGFQYITFFPARQIAVGPFHLSQDGTIKGAQLAQCSSDLTGRWMLRKGRLLLKITESYAFETCMERAAPYKSREYAYVVAELVCEDGNDGSGGRGTAVTTDGGEFDVLCEFD